MRKVSLCLRQFNQYTFLLFNWWPPVTTFAKYIPKLLVLIDILSEMPTIRRHIGEISEKRKQNLAVCSKFFLVYYSQLILITRVIECLELTFNKKDKFLLHCLFIILLHFAAIVAVASFYNPHAISHTSAVLHNESVLSPNNNWRWSTFCQTPQE